MPSNRLLGHSLAFFGVGRSPPGGGAAGHQGTIHAMAPPAVCLAAPKFAALRAPIASFPTPQNISQLLAFFLALGATYVEGAETRHTDIFPVYIA